MERIKMDKKRKKADNADLADVEAAKNVAKFKMREDKERNRRNNAMDDPMEESLYKKHYDRL